MRQKARKKGKRSKSSPKKNGYSAIVENLPKRDPVPPPKQSSLTQRPNPRAAPDPLGARAESSGVTTSRPIEQVGRNARTVDQATENPPMEPASGLERLLRDVSPDTDIHNAELTVQFGFILVRHLNDKTFLDGSYAPKKTEQKLQGAGPALHADFFSRMTTSDDDARYLLSLVDTDDLHARLEYEIHVKTSEGESRLVTFEQTSINDFQVWRTDTVLGILFIHHPMRVWDAQATIDKPEVDMEIMGSVRKFIESIQTIEQPPSFLATVPSHLYTVEKVYAKRIFSKFHRDVEVRVTEVQDLSLSSIDANGYNFKASVSSKESMIDDQQLWWELQLRVAPVGSVPPAELHNMVEEFIGKMDGIGYWNNGPFERREIEALPEQSVAETPFW